MLKTIFLCLIFLFTISAGAEVKKIEQEVFAKKSEVTAEMSKTDLLTLNGIRLMLTSELENLKLDSKLFWEKLDQKKYSAADELKELKNLFNDLSVAEFVSGPETAQPQSQPPAEKPPVEADEKISGSLKADLDLEKLKNFYDQLINNLEATKIKTFYILADIGLSGSTMSWEDLGVSKVENFSGVIVDSWIKLVQKDFKTFEAVIPLEKDFSKKPDYMNSRSVTLKWNSMLKKTGVDDHKKTAFYELTAQYVLVNSKSGSVLLSFDFPVQKRELNTQNKKALSSSLASLVYNLLLSQSSKIQGVLESQGSAERSRVELKLLGAGLSEVYSLNSLLQDKLKDFKASASMKSYSSGEAIIQLDADASVDQILDKLSTDGGKFPLNEQKVLLFNRADKSFAFIPKDSNN